MLDKSFFAKYVIVEINNPPYSPDVALIDFFLVSPKAKTVEKILRTYYLQIQCCFTFLNFYML